MYLSFQKKSRCWFEHSNTNSFIVQLYHDVLIYYFLLCSILSIVFYPFSSKFVIIGIEFSGFLQDSFIIHVKFII